MTPERGNDELLGAEGRAHVERKLASEIYALFVEQAKAEAQPIEDDPPEGRRRADT